MGLYDIIDDIAEKQVMKTETGDQRIFGVVLGVVTDNYDPAMKGRVCVTVPVRDENANNLKWARVAMPSSGKEWGHYFLPEIGDQVLLVFEQGNIEKPYVIGCIPKEADKFFRSTVKQNNELKRIVTKHGSTLEFEDAPQGDGEQDRIALYTPDNQHKIVMDNGKKQILISDEKGENRIELKTEAGEMQIRAASKLKVQVGDKVSIVMNGENGGVTIECNKLKVKAQDAIDMNSNAKGKFSAANLTLSASTALKAESGGTVQISGTPISIG
ncbi:MAG: phage baseplate assembly protein V [Clostridium sp.]|nr:phage baseplate assembly protein V [Clostridium sp.]